MNHLKIAQNEIDPTKIPRCTVVILNSYCNQQSLITLYVSHPAITLIFSVRVALNGLMHNNEVFR